LAGFAVSAYIICMKVLAIFFRLSLAVALFLAGVSAFGQAAGLPPNEAEARDRLIHSPRHGEWVKVDAGKGDMVDAWVSYPERSDKAPVVLVIHEIFGLTDWVRSVADQVAAEGYIAIAPDLLSGKGPGGKGTSSVDADTARTLIASLPPEEVARRLDASVAYATALPAASSKFAVMGFCWGGGISFAYATMQPGLSASIVFYGTPPRTDALSRVKAPVLAFYGGSDFRVTSTAAPTDAEMKRLGKRFEYEIYKGAGHAFMRAQDGQAGANMNAAQNAWPRAVSFLSAAFTSGASLLEHTFDIQPLLAALPGGESFRCVCDDGDQDAMAP
jgi:carboxymethylenebutenolidase